MKSRRSIPFLIGIALIAGALFAWSQRGQTADRIKLDSHRSLGAAKSFQNLAIIPVYDTSAKASDNYVTLDEGLKAKTVSVREAQQGGEVNELYISNKGQKPLYLMAGEVVLGGQQDRCIGHDTVIQPGKKRVKVTVFCVEHGRWTGHKDFDGAAKMVASAGIRADAQDGAFAANRPVAMAGVAGPPPNVVSSARPVRVARGDRSIEVGSAGETVDVGRAQQKVWDKVAVKNANFKAESNSGTYRKVLNMEAANAHNSVAPYLKAFEGGLGRDEHLVGAVAAINGKVVAADIFGDPTLFRKLWPKLLRSYAADAAENGSSKDAKAVSATDAKSFVLQSGEQAKSAENKSGVLSTLRLESKSSVSYKLVAPEMAKGRIMGHGGKAVLHENVIKK